MKLSTLNYIHEVLVEEEKATRGAKKLLYDARNKAEDEGADNYKDLCEAYDRAKVSWNKAYDALEDFESQVW